MLILLVKHNKNASVQQGLAQRYKIKKTHSKKRELRHKDVPKNVIQNKKTFQKRDYSK